jgi:hypothetical protein
VVYEDEPRDPQMVVEPDRGKLTWEIQFSRFGSSWVVVPKSLGPLPPSRIDLIIPDQTDWPPGLWSRLDARDSAHLRLPRLGKLGISHYLRAALQLWSDKLDDFSEKYTGAPFGSQLRLAAVTVDPADAEFTLHRSDPAAADSLFLSVEDLCGIWGIDQSSLPPPIPFTYLCHEEQLASEVILVSFRQDRSMTAVFKSARRSPSTIYHELKVILHMAPSPTIVEKPMFLVTLPCQDGRELVCGFLVKFYRGGSLDQVLPSRRLAGTLTLRQQLGWARDLTSSLIHVRDSPAKFYSDLRMDQLVLSPNEDGSETAILIDFEQTRNIYNWAPPEVYYLEWISELGSWEYARTRELTDDTLAKYGAILERYIASRQQRTRLSNISGRYDNPALGWYWPWVTSTAEERESGMVYMLGKALWCIFEAMEDADIVLGRSGNFPDRQRFPEFVRTPPELQPLIRDCTNGAREWIDGPIKIYRREGKIFPLGKAGLDGEPEGTLDETKQTIRDFWQGEMEKAEIFVAARQRYDSGTASDEDIGHLHYLKRPSLNDVKEVLETFAECANL